MIFCTIGTTNFSFSRLLNALDQALVGRNESLILQTGKCSYTLRYPYVKQYENLPYEKIVYYMTQAEKIICHGGAGTILLAKKYARVKPFVIPRLARYQEHVDNHQIYFSDYMKKQGDILVPSNQHSIIAELRHYIMHPPLKEKGASSKPVNTLTARLIAYTDSFPL